MKGLLITTCLLAGLIMPQALHAGERSARVEKKPLNLPGLESSGPFASELTSEERGAWKSVLHWCDECDERTNHEFTFSDCADSTLVVYRITEELFLVDVHCEKQINGSEHIYYKVKAREDSLIIRLLKLDQFLFLPLKVEEPPQADHFLELEQKGCFIRYTDSLIFGDTFVFPENPHQLHVLTNFRDSGGCGTLTVYNITGDFPKVVEFRAKTYCSANYPQPEEWKLYPASQRSTWRRAPNPTRQRWSSPQSACAK